MISVNLGSVLEIGWYVLVYHTKLLVIPEFHTGIYQYVLHPLIIFHFSDGTSLFCF
jgi:hypothetical protein